MKKVLKKSEVLREGYIKGLQEARRIIQQQLNESEMEYEELATVVNGRQMFERDYTLETFSAPLPNLETGDNMFFECLRLTSFTSKMKKLHSGYFMFNGCRNLREFRSSLSKLETGLMMFSDSRLDLESVKCIAKTIKTHRNRRHHRIDLGIDKSLRGDEEIEMCIDEIKSKGWSVGVNYN